MKRPSLSLMGLGLVLFFGITGARADSVDVSMEFPSCPASVLEGAQITYSLKALILTQSLSGNVTVTAPLPAGLTNVTATGTNHADHKPEPLCDNVSFCSITSGVVTCNLPDACMDDDIDADDVPVSEDFMLMTVKGNAPNIAGPMSFTASAQPQNPDPNQSNNSATCTTQVTGPGVPNEAELSITKTAKPTTITVGSTVTFTMNVHNAGLLAASAVTVTDNLPAQLSLVSAKTTVGSCGTTNPVTCNLGNMANGANATVTIVATGMIAASGVQNTATVASPTPDSTKADNSATATINIVGHGANLNIQKLANPNPVAMGSALTYTLWITNFGPDTALTPTVTDVLPSNVTFSNATVQANTSNNTSMGSCTPTTNAGVTTVSCTLINLASNNNATITIVVTPTSAGLLNNTATITSSNSNPASSTVQVTVTGGPSGNPPPILLSLSPSSATTGSPQLTMTVTGSQFLPGAIVTWAGTNLATSPGNNPATTLLATVPANLLTGIDPVTVLVVNPDSQKSGPQIFTMIPPTGACTQQAFVSGSVAPASVAPGGQYTLSCDYGTTNSNEISFGAGSGSCVFSQLNGTVAEFACTAGAQGGTFPNSCKLIQSAPDNFCSRTDPINQLTVAVPVLTSIEVSPRNASLLTNAKLQFIATAFDQNHNSMTLSTPFVWTNDNNPPNSVGANGLYQAGNNPGTDEVRATNQGVQGAASVIISSVTPPPPPPPNQPPALTSIEISPRSATVGTNLQIQFNATAFDQYHNPMNLGTPFVWTNNNNPPNSIDQAGLYQAGNVAGSDIVVVTNQGLLDQASVTITATPPVIPPPPGHRHLVISPHHAFMHVGDTLPFSAVSVDDLGHAVPVTPKWNVNGAGSISALGVLTALNTAPTAMITASLANNDPDTASVDILAPGAAMDITDAYAYPVPYKSTQGIPGIIFAKLAPNTKIRIFTANAKEIRTLGSFLGEQVTWDVRNTDGNRIASGVYFYIIDNANTHQTKKGKLVIVQ